VTKAICFCNFILLDNGTFQHGKMCSISSELSAFYCYVFQGSEDKNKRSLNSKIKVFKLVCGLQKLSEESVDSKISANTIYANLIQRLSHFLFPPKDGVILSMVSSR
jgi:hypothetical protein